MLYFTHNSIIYNNDIYLPEYGSSINIIGRPINHSIANINRLEKNHVAIILGYFNGHSYLGDQIKSIFNQSHGALNVHLCDDNSDRPFDENDFEFEEDELKKLSHCRRPKRLGYANNFLNGLSDIAEDFEYFAFSDQDDIWHRDKVERTISELSKGSSNILALYCSLNTPFSRLTFEAMYSRCGCSIRDSAGSVRDTCWFSKILTNQRAA